MRVAVVGSNYMRIHKSVKKGTEIFVYIYLHNLSRYLAKHPQPDLSVKVFASGDSELFFPIESIHPLASMEDKAIGVNHHKLFELALLSKAVSMQDQFDLYHVHIGNGEVILPFVPFLNKPVIITMHGGTHESFYDSYYQLFAQYKNVHFVSISNSQRMRLPHVNYAATIYHGIDTANAYRFSPHGGRSIMWAGRGIPEKGADLVVEVARLTKRPTRLYPIRVNGFKTWLDKNVAFPARRLPPEYDVRVTRELTRHELIAQYQKSRLFLFPLKWEEPFGLVIAESMACGTPVVAFARGSAPELIVDGVNGYLVNPDDADIRGNFIIKETGIAGLVEAIKRIYAMDQAEYEAMRQATRTHAENNYSIDRMIENYLDLYTSMASEAGPS